VSKLGFKTPHPPPHTGRDKIVRTSLSGFLTSLFSELSSLLSPRTWWKLTHNHVDRLCSGIFCLGGIITLLSTMMILTDLNCLIYGNGFPRMPPPLVTPTTSWRVSVKSTKPIMPRAIALYSYILEPLGKY
jgi:hypothetical protein